MWILFGVAAIITAVLNVIFTIRQRNAKWFRFISLSLTAFTLCAFYTQANQWVLMEYWSALMDVLPTMSKLLWILTFTSVLINSISLFKNHNQ